MQIRWKIAQMAERIWWKRYLENKNLEAYLTWKKKYWLQLLQTCKIDDILKNEGVIADLGCGPAGIFMIFDHSKIYAIDPLLDSYDADLEHFTKSDYPNVTFLNESLEEVNLPQKIDYLFCMNVINHVQNFEKCYDNMTSLLADKGTLIISIDAHNHSFFKKLFRLLPGDILHPHQYDLKEYQEKLTSRNFEITSITQLKSEFFFNHYVIVAHKKNK